MASNAMHTVIPHPIGGGGQRRSIVTLNGNPVGEMAKIISEKRHEKPYLAQYPKHTIVESQLGRVAYKPLPESEIKAITAALQSKQKK